MPTAFAGGIGMPFGLGRNAYVGGDYRHSNYEAGFERHQAVLTLGFRIQANLDPARRIEAKEGAPAVSGRGAFLCFQPFQPARLKLISVRWLSRW